MCSKEKNKEKTMSNIFLDVAHYCNEVDDINPLTMLAKTDEDTMYWNKALQQPDSAQFVQTAKDEINTNETNKHWVVVMMNQVPKNMAILDSVWSMKRK
jgi:predicted SnoaL-like aldol condensation-catalyzing enzyme